MNRKIVKKIYYLKAVKNSTESPDDKSRTLLYLPFFIKRIPLNEPTFSKLINQTKLYIYHFLKILI